MQYRYILVLLFASCLQHAHAGDPQPVPVLVQDHLRLFEQRDPAAHWWQWALSVPAERNPVRDQNGQWCAQAQQPGLWLLAGSFETVHIKRKCSVPSGTPVFFPIINAIEASLSNCDLAAAEARRRIDSTANIQVVLNDTIQSGNNVQRFASQGCFRLAGTDREFAADGYWYMLGPLPPGKHKIHFEADMGQFRQNITYTLDVQKDQLS